MERINKNEPDYLFEVSWEACNKEGSIYTVLSTKAEILIPKYGDHYFFIGPDIWKQTEENPYFVEDSELLKDWKIALKEAGLNIRIGYWKQASNAQTILIDFTSLFPSKDSIFSHLWESYQLDSITGQWDYIEPALFGYAAGKVIAHFTTYFNHKIRYSNIAAHFHEWMTGVGILYLKEQSPDIATVFTAYSTVLGRSICASGKRLYGILRNYDPDKTAHELNVFAKFSLERAAATNADAFTAISEITSVECEHFLGITPKVITPNGFPQSLLLLEKVVTNKRQIARQRLKKVAEALLNQHVSDDVFFVVNSGKYDFRNKGIDIFIEALAQLQNNKQLTKEIIAWILIPANQLGARKRLLRRLVSQENLAPIVDDYLTHSLFDEENDPVLNFIKSKHLLNTPENKVKIIFVPASLDGHDDIFNLDYYNLLVGMDFSVYPSFYEPWGNPAMESAALGIPTLTTNLSGVGQWAKSYAADCANGLIVIDRQYDNYDNTVNSVASAIKDYSEKDAQQIADAKKEAIIVANRASWDNFINFDSEALHLATHQAVLRKKQFIMDIYRDITPNVTPHSGITPLPNSPIWHKIFVNPAIPRSLSGLIKLSKNLWWSWDHDTISLFESMSTELWEQVERNPIKLIEEMPIEQWKQLEKDHDFIKRFKDCEHRFDQYMDVVNEKKGYKIAYFSMEYGLDNTIKIFSGGLGMLAGDYLKEASDCNIDIIGVGLLYRYGYFKQSLSSSGDQIAEYIPQQFNHLPLVPVRDETGAWVTVNLAFPGRTLSARVWCIQIGRIPLYLLDSHIDENTEEDRMVTDQLYGGNSDNRLKQELLLGVGGIRLLEKLNIKPDVFHCNEGHAAFIGIERINMLVREFKLTFAQAKEVVRASSLFTTHTPVPAGHDYFTEDLLRTYIPHYADRLNISWNDFMNLGRFTENNSNEKFSMSILAINLSQEVNGVSKIHGRISREMFKSLYPGYYAEELHIGYVTNGVHLPSWVSKQWLTLYKKYFDEQFITDQANETHWQKIFDVPDADIWNIRKSEKNTLYKYIGRKIRNDMVRRQENPKMIHQILDNLNPDALTIGFARRFATYKRALLIFNNITRLNNIVNNPERPVVFIFAGKAHPNDDEGKSFIRRIIEISRMPEFVGKILFLENYDMQVAKYLIRGVDIWLNTPTRPLEASGTSGEKAVMNGIINLSVLDGWWAEGYRKEAGWALPEERTYVNQSLQDELDAENIYYLLENEITPKYYDCNKQNIPEAWLSYIRNTIAQIAPHYTMKRMLDEYINKYYNKLYQQHNIFSANHFEKAKELTEWKQHITQAWNKINVINISTPEISKKFLSIEDTFEVSLSVDLGEFTPNEVGIEIIFTDDNNSCSTLDNVVTMKARKGVERMYIYECRIPLQKAGSVNFAIRIFPQHPLLVHRTDLKSVIFL